MDYLEQIEELIERSHELENNITKVNIIEAAIKLADSYQDIERGLKLRMYLIDTLYECGYPEKLLVAFSWCLAQYDREPERFGYYEWRLMWTYKWVVEFLPYFPQISRQQINDSFADMQSRYLHSGSSLRAVYQKQLLVAVLIGDRDLALQYYQQWQDTTNDSSSDCAGCELSEEVDFLLFMGKDQQALDKSQPITSGKLRCSELPHLTLSRLLIPLVKLQHLEIAVNYHLQSCHKVSENNKYLALLAEHILFLSLTNNTVKAINLLEKNINIALTTTAIHARFYFFRAVYFLMSHLQSNNTHKISLLLPHDFPLYQTEMNYQVSDLANWFKSQAETIAEQFDRRNDNNFYSHKLQELAELKQYQVDYPINSEQRQNNSVNLNRGEILDAPIDA